MTGRCAKNDKDSVTEGTVQQAAELLQGQWNGRQAHAVSRMKQLRVLAGQVVPRKQAEMQSKTPQIGQQSEKCDYAGD